MLSRPALTAPAMSVSSRSPTNNGWCAPSRLDRVVQQRPIGLASHFRLGLHSHLDCGDRRAVARHQSTIGRPRRIDVRRDPMGTAMDGDRGFVEFLPRQVEAIALHHRDRMVIGGMHSDQACFAQCRDDSLAPDGEDSGASTEAVDQQMCGGLSRGDDVGRGRRDTKLDQMISDRGRRAGRVVGDKADLGTTIMERRNAFCRARHGDRAQIDDAVEVEQAPRRRSR